MPEKEDIIQVRIYKDELPGNDSNWMSRGCLSHCYSIDIKTEANGLLAISLEV